MNISVTIRVLVNVSREFQVSRRTRDELTLLEALTHVGAVHDLLSYVKEGDIFAQHQREKYHWGQHIQYGSQNLEMELGYIFKKCVVKGASRLMKFAVPSNCICSYIFLHLLDLSSIVSLSLVEPLAFDQINNCIFSYK